MTKKTNPHEVKYVPNPNRPPGVPGTGIPVNPAPPRPKK